MRRVAWRWCLHTLAAGLAGLALAGCESAGVAAPPSPVVVEIQPAGTVELQVGDTLTLKATVLNLPSGAAEGVRFSSSNTGVATVDAGGRVRALAAGVVTVTATSLADEGAAVAVVIRVRPREPLPTAAVSIRAILASTGGPVRADSVAGPIVVLTDVRRGTGDVLEVLLNATVACRIALDSAAVGGEGEMACPVNTVRIDSAGSRPVHVNGPATITARLLDAAGAVVATARLDGLVLRNRSTLLVSIRAARSANDARGRSWLGGDLTVGVVPVVFEAGETVERVWARYRRSDGSELVRSDSSSPFEIRISADSLVLADSAFRLDVTSAVGAQRVGPAAASDTVRYDNLAPTPGRIVPREWIGAATQFASLYDPVGEADAGVGRTSVRFFTASSGVPPERIVTGGRPVTRGAELEASTSAQAYAVAGLLCDALENCVVLPGFTFGVDLAAPEISDIGVADRAVNPRQDISLVVRDDRSGAAAVPLEVSVRRVTAGSGEGACGPLVEGIDLPGRTANGACLAEPLAGVIPVPRTTSGYYVYTIVAVDRAGNRSAPVVRTILVDVVPPAVGPITLPERLTGGEPTTLSAAVTDDLDLRDGSFRFVFRRPGGGVLAIPLASPTDLGTPFDGKPVAAATLEQRVPFLRSLTFAGAGAATTPRLPVLVDSIRARVTDAAGQSAVAGRAVPPEALDARPTTDPFADVRTATVATSGNLVCSVRCLATEADSVTLTFSIVGDVGLRNPFTSLIVYRQGPDGQVSIVRSNPAPSIVETGNQRTFVYTVTYRPPAGLEGGSTFFAVGMAGGNGLRTAEAAVSFFAR